MAHRYFTSEINNNSARISGQDAAHLCRVLRTKPGDILTLCDGLGTDYTARADSVTADEILFTVLESAPCAAEPSVDVLVCVALSKGEKMEWAIQKSVELGAGRILPFVSENTVVKIKNPESKNERYTRIAYEAAKQCGRGILPVVELPVSYKQMIDKSSRFGRALFLYEKSGIPIGKAIENHTKIAIISGAEGGFSPEEADYAEKSGCIITGLGPRILRCETAPVAALAAIMALTGNL